MKIQHASVFVDEQEKAVQFYTEVLGFVQKTDMPADDFRWLTVVSPEGPQDIELLLEPNDNPAARTYQEAIYQAGIPATSFTVDNMEQEYQRLTKLGVEFRTKPTKMEWGTYAVFDDTSGNLINLHQPA